MSDHLLRGLFTVRKLLGYTAEDCARRLAITPSSYSRHERGERRMYFDKVYHLAEYLGVPMELFTQHLTIDQRQELWLRGEKRRELLAKGADHAETDILADWGDKLEPAPEPTAFAAPAPLTTLGPPPATTGSVVVQPELVPDPGPAPAPAYPGEDPALAGLTEADRVARIMEDWGADDED